MNIDTEFNIKFSRMVLVQDKNKAESLKLADELWRDFPDLISIYFIDHNDLINWILGIDDLAKYINQIQL